MAPSHPMTEIEANPFLDAALSDTYEIEQYARKALLISILHVMINNCEEANNIAIKIGLTKTMFDVMGGNMDIVRQLPLLHDMFKTKIDEYDAEITNNYPQYAGLIDFQKYREIACNE